MIVFLALGYGVFRGRTRVGSIFMWTVLLIMSAIVLPLVGEIGTAIGV